MTDDNVESQPPVRHTGWIVTLWILGLAALTVLLLFGIPSLQKFFLASGVDRFLSFETGAASSPS
jgi:hypothetical protein